MKAIVSVVMDFDDPAEAALIPPGRIELPPLDSRAMLAAILQAAIAAGGGRAS